MIPENSRRHIWALPITFVIALLFQTFNIMGWNNNYFHDTWFGVEFSIPPIYGQFLIVSVISFLVAVYHEIMQVRKHKGDVPVGDSLNDVIVTVLSSLIGFLIVKFIFVF